jgi:hypothetical protein
MIEVLGWVSTALVLVGFILNAKGIINWAMVTWIVGDIGWITYDFFIDNFSHLVLSLVIISINIYGIINLKKNGLKGV